MHIGQLQPILHYYFLSLFTLLFDDLEYQGAADSRSMTMTYSASLIFFPPTTLMQYRPRSWSYMQFFLLASQQRQFSYYSELNIHCE